MTKLTSWDQLIGKRISIAIQQPPDRWLRLMFTDGTYAELEAELEPLTLDFYPASSNPRFEEPLPLGCVVGKKIEKLVVPFLAPDVSDAGWITFGFDDNTDIFLAAEHPYRAIKLK